MLGATLALASTWVGGIGSGARGGTPVEALGATGAGPRTEEASRPAW